MAKFKKGDKLVYGKGKVNKAFAQGGGITVGRLYEIIGKDEDGDAYFEDDNTVRRYPHLQMDAKITKIVD